MIRLDEVLSSSAISDLDRLAVILVKGCETPHDHTLVAEAVALVAEHRILLERKRRGSIHISVH